MTQISRDDVSHLAMLSNLQLSEDEIDNLVGDITNILSYVEQLDELDVENVAPTYQVTGLKNVWRDDEVKMDGVERNALLSLAAEVADHQIKVPKVL